MNKILEKLKEKLIKDENIVFGLVFGSYAKECQNSRSDIDIGLYFLTPPQGLDLLDFISGLCKYAGKEVDLAVLNHASAFLRHQVMKHAVRLFVKDRLIYRKFREKTMTDYDIYKHVSGMNIYDRQSSDGKIPESSDSCV
ncbi:MAG: nucleotidyltransferase family protein [Desulfococcaceae bacterium]